VTLERKIERRWRSPGTWWREEVGDLRRCAGGALLGACIGWATAEANANTDALGLWVVIIFGGIFGALFAETLFTGCGAIIAHYRNGSRQAVIRMRTRFGTILLVLGIGIVVGNLPGALKDDDNSWFLGIGAMMIASGWFLRRPSTDQ
jgi:hypothetical protein